jgi:hypothetical protein
MKEESGKIVWETANITYNFYPLTKEQIGNEDGGFEYEMILKSKPKINKFNLEIETNNLEFYYQPALTQQEIEEKTKRPENVVGSYAVYHSSLKNGEYKTGKAFHIYRPKITDNTGDWIWGELNITDNILSITIDKKWLDNASYPVIIDPTFGYETAGASQKFLLGQMYCSVFSSPSGGSVSQMAAYLSRGEVIIGAQTRTAIYNHSDSSLVSNGSSILRTINYRADWFYFTFSTNPIIVTSDYVLCTLAEYQELLGYINYDSGSTNQGHYVSSTGYDPPNPASFTHDNNKYSIYATYTDTCTYSGSGDWYVNFDDNCYVGSNTYVAGILHLMNNAGSGSFNIIDGANLMVQGIDATSTYPIRVETTSGAKIEIY